VLSGWRRRKMRTEVDLYDVLIWESLGHISDDMERLKETQRVKNGLQDL
jgi:hypothetical protein